MKITLAHAGKQHSYHISKCMQDCGVLDKFYTSSYVKNISLQKFLLKSNNKYFVRRFLYGLGGKYVKANWHFELKEMFILHTKGKGKAFTDAVFERDMKFDKYMSKVIKKRKSDVFWGFQGSCHDTLISAKKSGKKTILELAIAHAPAAKNILAEEAELNPEWAQTLDFTNFTDEYEKRLENEPIIADIVVAASSFTKQTLIDYGIDADKIYLLPLGFDAKKITYIPKKNTRKNKQKIKILFAGTVTQRKGIKYLLEAMKLLDKNKFELHIIGNLHGNAQILKKYADLFTLHKPVEQSVLFDRYSIFDILVLPSIFEGFGLVIIEAMAAGLPVITTNHSIGYDIIKNGINGYVIPIRNTEKIAEKLNELYDMPVNQYLEMRKQARLTAMEYTWEKYCQRLENFVKTLEKT